MILSKQHQKYQHYHLEKLIYIYIYIYEYLTEEEILRFNQRQMIELAYSALGKTFEKQTKTSQKKIFRHRLKSFFLCFQIIF